MCVDIWLPVGQSLKNHITPGKTTTLDSRNHQRNKIRGEAMEGDGVIPLQPIGVGADGREVGPTRTGFHPPAYHCLPRHHSRHVSRKLKRLQNTLDCVSEGLNSQSLIFGFIGL